MKKKLLTIAVTAAMVFSLVACGSNGGSNETKADGDKCVRNSS